MQNLIVICRQCISWIEPVSDRCPDCGVPVILDQPDPDPETLAKVLGNPLALLGPVRIDRTRLPGSGVLVGTTEGLLFVPRLHRRPNGAWQGVSHGRMPGWWPFGSEPSTHRFFDWLRRPATISLKNDAKHKSEELPDWNNSLADRLMESPGALFVNHRQLKGMVCRRKLVKLQRAPFRDIVLIDESANGTLPAALDSLALRTSQSATLEPHS